MTTTFEDTFRDEERLRSALLERRVHPDDLAGLLRYVPPALTHLTWRNTVLEEWHGGPNSRITDAEMMRANVATTRIFHQALWFIIGDSWAEFGPLSVEMVDVDELAAALTDALDTAFDAERLLPHGVTLGDLGGDEFHLLRDHAEQQLGALLRMGDQHGAHRVLMWLGLRVCCRCRTGGEPRGGHSSSTNSSSASTTLSTTIGASAATLVRPLSPCTTPRCSAN